MTVGTADGATAAAASAVDEGVDVDTDPDPAATAPPAAEHISSFLLHIRRCADDKAAGLVLDAAPPDTGTGVTVGSAPGVAVTVVITDPAADMDVVTAGDLFDDVVDFDPTLAWGDSDEVTATVPAIGAAAPAGASQPPTSADTCMDIGAVAASSATGTRKRKARGSRNHVTRDEHKRQRKAALLLTAHANTGAST